MALTATAHALTGAATATLVATAKGSDETGGDPTVVICSNQGGQTAYFGPTSAVTNSDGLPIPTATIQAFVLNPGETLYCYVVTTSTVNILVNGQ